MELGSTAGVDGQRGRFSGPMGLPSALTLTLGCIPPAHPVASEARFFSIALRAGAPHSTPLRGAFGSSLDPGRHLKLGSTEQLFAGGRPRVERDAMQRAVTRGACPAELVALGLEGMPGGDGVGAGAGVADAVAEVAAEGASEAADADEEDD